MALKLSDLPYHYQLQALKQLKQKEAKASIDEAQPKDTKKQKYRNKPTERQGLKFQSKHEADRFEELLLLEQAGQISDLKLQYEYTLKPAYMLPTGVRSRAVRYKADFRYERDGQIIVEDAKGKRTKDYIIKYKLMQEVHGITIQEV